MVRYSFFVISLLLSQLVAADIFDDAQLAARGGRYHEVISILSGAIDAGELEGKEWVIAYSNRGIAYSLLRAYGLARADLEQAISLEPGHSLTQNHLGIIAEHVDHNYGVALAWYQQAVLGGFSASMVNLANLYRKGLGVPINNSRALELYEQAAEKNYAMAYVPLGIMYMEGLGVSRDYKLGIAWLRRGRDQGVIKADYRLGIAFEKGLGVKQDYTQAAASYHVAAMQGHGKAQNSLGYLYRRGSGVKQDFQEAVGWYQLAADQGINQATNRLAWLLATCPTTKVCNGEEAVALASRAVEEEPTASNMDSLAAAYARIGDFKDAIATIERILSLPDSKRYRYANRLDLYRQGKPYEL